LPVVGSAVTGRGILSATEHEPCGVGPERKVSIAIISGGKTATGADRVHRNGLIRYFHHSAQQISGTGEIINRTMRNAFMAPSDSEFHDPYRPAL
jgi:hypothetical protein